MASFPSAPFRYRGQHFLAGVVPYLSNCMIWAPLWANRRICFYCDNQAAIAILSAKSSKIPRVMNLVWLITFQTLSFNFTFTAKYVPRLLMSLLSVSFPDVTVPPSCTRCIASSLLSDPYIFYQSLTMLTTCIIAQCIAASTSCSCLFKTLHDIKSFFGILQAITPSHHSFNPPPNLSSGTFDIQIHLTRLEVSFCPDQLQPDYFETVVKNLKQTPSGRQPSSLQPNQTHPYVLFITASRDYFQTSTHPAAQSLFQFSDYSGYLTRSSFTHNIYGPC